METQTAPAPNPTDASASSKAPATLLATAGTETGTPQQTDPAQTQTPPAAEKLADGTPKTETAAAAGAPESYTFQAPGGTEYDPEVLEAFSGAAKEANLTQDAAQKLIEKMAPAITARQADQVQAIHTEWREAAAADSEFGGAKLLENLAVAKKAYDLFDPIPAGQKTTPLRTLMDETGLGNHPEMIRLLFRAGKAISEDKFVGGRNGAATGDATAVLYNGK